MNDKGILCFVIVLAFASYYLTFLSSGVEAEKHTNQAVLIAMEIEKAHLVKTNLEDNFDLFVKENVEWEIKAGNTNSENLKVRLGEKIFRFFREFENSYTEKIKVDFFQTTASKKEYSRIGNSKKKKKFDKGFLPDKINIMVLHLKEKVYLVEFNYTGGLLKNQVVFALLESGSYKGNFLVPIDYSQKIVVVG